MSKLKKGQIVTMYFRCAGVTSEEQLEVKTVHKDGTISVTDIWTSDSGKEDYGRFDLKTGKCLNDNTFFGASRRIDPVK